MIEVVKGALETNREKAEDNVLWALNTALDVVQNINSDLSDESGAMSNGDALFVASMLLSELKNTD